MPLTSSSLMFFHILHSESTACTDGLCKHQHAYNWVQWLYCVCQAYIPGTQNWRVFISNARCAKKLLNRFCACALRLGRSFVRSYCRLCEIQNRRTNVDYGMIQHQQKALLLLVGGYSTREHVIVRAVPQTNFPVPTATQRRALSLLSIDYHSIWSCTSQS